MLSRRQRDDAPPRFHCLGSCLRRLIETVPLFKMFHVAFIRRIVMMLQSQVFLAGDPVIRVGEAVPGMFFGESGLPFSVLRASP